MLILGLLASKNERLNLQIPLPSLEDSIASFCSLCLLFFIFVAGLSHKNRWYFTPKISSILSCLTCQFSCLSNYLKSFHSTITLMTGDDTVFFVVALEVVQSLRSHITKHYSFINGELKLATTTITSTICPVHLASGHQCICFHLFLCSPLRPVFYNCWFSFQNIKYLINLSSVSSSSSWSVLTKYLILFKSVLLVKLVQIHSLLTRCFLSHSWIDTVLSTEAPCDEWHVAQ